ncbi:M81 family metallopeptidase [Sphingobacterium sp. SGG-5]|uniref:M81 family metallopeptidase n=1 Tax=Sphingobacterium sp. SGG-5 TaxID=2710881 RepID=UPI0013EA6377|nr:M81 family metallopeptidase [Sphingobacterium sp. SGG-5]NGM60402.1 M81 family metallopeptidase [Sphingobacterium sp. SGG-5]
MVLLFFACNSKKEKASSSSYRVAVAAFSHETCTFCPGEEPGIDDWTYRGAPLKGEELLQGTKDWESNDFIQGFVQQAGQFDNMTLIGLTSPRDVFGGSSRTWNKQEVFDHFVNLMLNDLKAAMPVDGVFLALHGAMAVRGIDRPEAEIAKRFREVVGPDIPIVATFDLHGNEDQAFFEWADGSFVNKRFPHYDSYQQGERAARYIHQMMRGEYKPTKAAKQIPILTATVLQWTGQSPMMNIYERARRWENEYPGAYVNIFLGFPWADVPDVGTCVQVMTNNDQALANKIADDMSEFIWRVRQGWSEGEFLQPEAAVKQTRLAITNEKTPVILADYWDRPGDGTWTLHELIKQRVDNVLYAALTDVNALDSIWKQDLQPGAPFDMLVGGYTGEQAGSPVHINGKLIWRGSLWGYDRVAAIAFGDGNILVLTPGYQQCITPDELRFGPINPDDYDVIVLKSRVHFRRGFDETGYAPSIFIVDAPGNWFGTTRLDALKYTNIDVTTFYPFGDVKFSQ